MTKRDPPLVFEDADETPPRYVKTDAAIARYFGISINTLNTWKNTVPDMPQKGPKGWDLWEWARFFRQKYARERQQKSSAGGDSPRSAAQTEKLEIETEAKRFQLDQAMGNLIHVDELRPTIADWVSWIKSQLSRLPTLILRVIPDNQQAIVQKQLDEIIPSIMQRIVDGYIESHSVRALMEAEESEQKGRRPKRRPARKRAKRKTKKRKAKA